MQAESTLTWLIRAAVLRRGAVALAAMLALAAGGIARADSHVSSQDLRDRAADARAQEQTLAGDIAVKSQQIDALESVIDLIGDDVARLEAQLDRSRSLLRTLDAELAEKTRTLKRARRDLAIGERRLAARLVEIYTAGDTDAIAVVLGAESLDDLIDLVDASSRVVEQDDALVTQIEELRARTIRERAGTVRLRRRRAAETARLQRNTDERRRALSSLVSRRDSLFDLRAARRQSLASVRVQRREWETEAEALETQSARVASVVSASPVAGVAPPDAPASSPSPGFIWPVQGTLISPFGQRWGRLHAGIDIAAPAGTPIAASASGQVVYAGAMSGYGLIVVVQHSGGIATAYAHNSSISVAVGQTVSQGQTIAAVGCTGRCFGNHVQFEVRVGGTPVDPMGYL